MSFNYDPTLKPLARRLRQNMTEAERRLWSRLRGKQLHARQFYRQTIIGRYIVDFYCPAAKLVVEVDGGQHVEAEHLRHDARRDAFLEAQGLRVLRFNNREVLKRTDAVVEVIGLVLEKSP